MQKCLLDQIGKVGVELKISNGQKVFLHKSDVETSHDIPFKYFFKNSSKCLEVSVDAYNSTLCKNPVMFFEKFEWINLFFILAQFGDLNCNSILFCSGAHDPFSYL